MAKKRFYRFPLYLIVRTFALLISWLPKSVLTLLSKFLGSCSFWLVARQRNKALLSLEKALGNEKSEQELQKIAVGSFQNVICTGFELLKFPRLSKDFFHSRVDFGEVLDRYKEILKEGNGLISITAHMGAWELLAAAIIQSGLEGSVVGRKIYYQPYNDWLVGLRDSLGVHTLYRGDASRATLKLLKQNKIIGVLPDQDIDSLRGIFVPYFGRLAYTTIAPVRLALSTGAPLLPNFLIRTGDWKYKFIVGEAIRPVVTTTVDEAVVKYTKQWMNAFESIIREYPDQWAWMHDRWKTKPPQELAEAYQEELKEKVY